MELLKPFKSYFLMVEYRMKTHCYACGTVIENIEYESGFKGALVSVPSGDGESAKLVAYCFACFEKWQKDKKK